MDRRHICPKLCFCAADAEGIIGDVKILRVAVACRLEVGVSGLLRSGDAGKVLPLAVNGDGYRRTVCGRLVNLSLRNGVIKIRHKLAHFRKRRASFLLQNQSFFTHGGRFRLDRFRRGRVMLRFRDVQRLDFYVVGQVHFLGGIERDGFGDGLRLLLFLFFNKRAYKRNVFSAEDGKALPVLKSHIAQRYFIRAEIYAVNDKLPSVNLQLHANGDILLGIGLVDNIIAVGFIWLRKHEAVSMLQQPLCGACPLSKIIAGHSGFAHTGNIALQQAAIQSAGGSFCIRAIKKQPFSDTDTDELFGMLCTKRLICRNIRRKLTTLICNSCEDSRNRFGSVFRLVIALAGG